MDKGEVLAALLDSLKAEFDGATAASQDAADYATNEESRAESEWDTQGLEASYLAAGQASQARNWAEAIETVEQSRNELLAPKEKVALGALVDCDLDGSREHFFVAPAAGGQVIEVDGKVVTVVTPQSPLAARIFGKREAESFSLANGAPGTVLTVQ